MMYAFMNVRPIRFPIVADINMASNPKVFSEAKTWCASPALGDRPS